VDRGNEIVRNTGAHVLGIDKLFRIGADSPAPAEDDVDQNNEQASSFSKHGEQ
jgi:hypothetical protein